MQFEYTDVPNITYQDEVINLSQRGTRKLRDLIQRDNLKQLSSSTIFSFLFSQFKFEIVFIVFLYALEMACRLGFSILLQELFFRVSHINEGYNKRTAYIYSVCCGVLWLIGQVSKQNAYYQVSIVGRIRSQLVFLIYTKLSKISQYTAKSQELGKIINLLSNDFNTIETKGSVFFAALVTPFALAGIIVILITRFGWPGILILGVILLILPVQILVGKLNGTIIQKINVYKD